MKLAALICLAAAVAGGAVETTKPGCNASASVRLIQPKPNPNGLTVYSPEGYKVADCAKSDHDLKFSDCKIEKGFTLDDLMNAFVQAYLKKGNE